MTAPRCGYCGELSRKTTGKEVYPHKPKLSEIIIYVCDPCHASVGCHVGTDRATGTLAKRSLKGKRIHTHRLFDYFWKQGYMSRKRAYENLAFAMGIPFKFAHIGLFNETQCDEAMRVCKKWRKKYEPTATEDFSKNEGGGNLFPS